MSRIRQLLRRLQTWVDWQPDVTRLRLEFVERIKERKWRQLWQREAGKGE